MSVKTASIEQIRSHFESHKRSKEYIAHQSKVRHGESVAWVWLSGWVLIGVLTHMENSYFAQSLVFVAFCIFFVCCLFSGNYAHQSRRCSVYLAAKTQYWTQQNVHFQLHQWADPARCKWSLIRHKQLLVALHLCFHVCTPYIPGSFYLSTLHVFD